MSENWSANSGGYEPPPPPPPGQYGQAQYGHPSAGQFGPPREHPPGGIAALILGILGLTAMPVIGPILALVFGYQSKRQSDERPHEYRDDFGSIGRVLGWIGVALTVLGVVFFLGILTFVGAFVGLR